EETRITVCTNTSFLLIFSSQNITNINELNMRKLKYQNTIENYRHLQTLLKEDVNTIDPQSLFKRYKILQMYEMEIYNLLQFKDHQKMYGQQPQIVKTNVNTTQRPTMIQLQNHMMHQQQNIQGYPFIQQHARSNISP